MQKIPKFRRIYAWFLFIVGFMSIVGVLSFLKFTPEKSPFANASKTSISVSKEAVDTRKLAYVMYLTDSHSHLECALKVMIQALRNTNMRPNVDFVVMTNAKIDQTQHIFKDVVFVKIPQPKTRGVAQYDDSFSKLYFSNLLNYTRIVYLELDCLVLQNLDHLFDISVYYNTIAAPRAYWLPQPFFQSGKIPVFLIITRWSDGCRSD